MNLLQYQVNQLCSLFPSSLISAPRSFIWVSGVLGVCELSTMCISTVTVYGFDTWLVLEKTFESPLNSREIKPVNSKTNQPWIFVQDRWKDWCWSSNSLATWCEELTHWKRPWCWERLRSGGEGGYRGWDGWMASLTQWAWVWANEHGFEQTPGDSGEQRSVACCSLWGGKKSG